MLEQLESAYGVRLPRKVITLDYDEDAGDIYIRFKNSEATEGEPTADGKTIFYYEKTGVIAGVETILK